MDHLRLPQQPYSEYPVIKLLCGISDPTDGSISIPDLGEFPYDQATFLEPSGELPTLDAAAPFLQAWLWFGLLENVFDVVGVPFDYRVFIVDDEAHGHRLSTQALHRHFWYWVAAESLAGDSERPERVREINRLLDQAFEALQCYQVRHSHDDTAVPDIEDRTAFGPFLADDSSNVLMAIVIIGEALDHAQESIYNDLSEGQGRAWDETLSIRHAMIEAGWCIKEIERLTYQLTYAHVTTLLFLSRINRHTLGKPHGDCTLELCVHEKIDYTTYRPIHVEDGCQCKDIAPRYDSMKRMDLALCHGNIPLLKFEADHSFGPELHVEVLSARDRQTPFVAISHVWSDRMGNLHENALPFCQLQRLQEEVNALYPDSHGEVPFWVDTLCVPREGTARRMAIKGMRQVYELAEKVLVLDSSLRTLDSTIAPEDLLLRVHVAPWSTRLWTYHEGALARRIYFQLSERALNGDEIEAKYMSQYSPGADTVEVSDLISSAFDNKWNRALVRAIFLKNRGDGFLLSLEETDTPARKFLSERLGSEDDTGSVEGTGSEEGILPSQQEASSDDDDDGEVSVDWSQCSDIELLNEATAKMEEAAAASEARTKAIYAEIARLQGEAQDWQNIAAVKKEEVAERRLNMLGGIDHRQILARDLHVDVPQGWLEQPPNACDRSLVSMMTNISHNLEKPRFWLRAFDPLLHEGLRSYYNLRTSFKRLELNMKTGSVPQAGQIREIISALRWRATSWIGDEATCCAIILGMDVNSVQRAPPDERMAVLASMWQEIPTELAFSNSKRISIPGFRWMPQSILGQGLNTLGTSLRREDGLCTPRGVELQAEGVLFSFEASRLHGDSLAISKNAVWYEVFVDKEGEEGSLHDIESGMIAILYGNCLTELTFHSSTRGIVAKFIEEEEDKKTTLYLSHSLCVRVHVIQKPEESMYQVTDWTPITDDQICCIS